MISPASKIVKKSKTWSNFHLRPLLWVIFGLAIIVLAAIAIGMIVIPGQSTVDIGNGQANSLVDMQKGNHLRVTLAGNPTTGYNWEVSQVDSQILKQVGETQFQADSSAVGSGGKVILEFEAIGTGTTNLQLIYHRSWETGVLPLQTYAVTVRVGN